ncbi:metallophosphoesterase [Saccharothrix hoggarensis]|uniref:Metallophosphoesterase n=1 Tax=Saccharothrix hoggarensis TaxID=913853 RepID=A0ABW3QP08_9PSEU
MALILHLSDLHLAPLRDDETLGDYKRPVVPAAERARRTSRIRSSLRALGTMLDREQRTLDAVVVSGDVTDRGSVDGFALLQATLAELGATLPPPESVMVVPGNHDVRWYTAPSHPDRYAAFVAGVRSLGYRTPLLEGVDLVDEHTAPATGVDPVMMLDGGTVAVVGLNTANYCGVEEDTDPEVADAVRTLDSLMPADEKWDALRRDWRRRGSFDIARLGPLQRRWAAHLLHDAVQRVDGDGPVVRVAVMHHQLLPVGIDEEVKPFESLVNLGEVREFLAANDIDVVLHGHKHTAGVYEDHYTPNEGDTPVRAVVVCSVRTIGKGQSGTGEFARLVDIDTGMPTLRRVRIQSVPARTEGVPLHERDLTGTRSFLLAPPGSAAASLPAGSAAVFAADTAALVHERMLDAVRQPGGLPTPTVCRITDGPTALLVPPTYPEVPGHAPHRLQQWFTEMVGWWQRPQAGRGMQFNHGERLRRFRADLDQIDRVVTVLRAEPDSSRALAVLVDPVDDRIDDPTARFPAFTLVHFLLTAGAVDVLAYFRKQEMAYWWPINVAELATLQREIAHRLTETGRTARAGAITTVTALPQIGRSVPQVALPIVDRIADEDRTAIVRNVAALVAPAADRAAERAWWKALFADWYPADEPAPDGDPAPTWGLEVLRDTVKAFAEAFPDQARLSRVAQRLTSLIQLNTAYLLDQQRGHTVVQRARWADQVRQLVDDLLLDVNRRLDRRPT